MSRIISAFLILFACCEGSPWDLEYWQYVNWKQGEKSYATSLIRFNHHISKFHYYRFSECFVYPVQPWLDLEAHFSYIYTKPRSSNRFNNSCRLELEANPSVKLPCNATLSWRNRLELQKKHGVSHIQFILRHRIMLAFSRFRMAEELFYNFDSKRFTENRLIPAEVTFPFEGFSLSFFGMVRNYLSNSKWHRSLVMAIELGF